MGRTAILKTVAVEQVLDSISPNDSEAIESLISLVEELLDGLESETEYPSEFVYWRLTGQRDKVPDEAIPGTLLRRELVVLVQRASALSPSSLERIEGGGLDLHEAAASIGVSVRTLQRWRDQGLVFRHILFPDGQVRLGVSHRALARYREQVPERFLQAARFSRIDAREEQKLLEETRRLMLEGASPNQAALEVASSSPRAHETIRQLIRRQRGERGPVMGAGGRVTSKERRLVLRAWDRGVPTDEVAHRLARSRGAIRRIAAEARADRLRTHRPSWMHLPVFENPEAERILLEAPQVREGPAPAHSRSISSILERGAEDSKVLEALLLPAMHLQRLVVARAIDSLVRTPSVGRLDRIETGFKRADILRLRVGQAVLGAALARVQHAEGAPLEELPPEGRMLRLVFCITVVDRMLDEFDPRARGELEPRLDRRVALETDKQIALQQRRGAPSASTAGRPVPEHLGALLSRLEPMRGILGLSPHLARRRARLDPGEQALLEARYGLEALRPQTIEQLAQAEGSSSRQITARLAHSIHELRAV
ncbi:MAG: hypothetical protein CBC35_03690 [Planctomycetes bacterium TMED75]|nr:hypothetical protein [Planctomycetaceae bacterium]OUU94592.1 MAG: hypothetical protein CBC35_03690 [Planctomycetes bacterium TMED75]